MNCLKDRQIFSPYLNCTFIIIQISHHSSLRAEVSYDPISLLLPQEIGDVCTQATLFFYKNVEAEIDQNFKNVLRT